jgi:hypothetical protein
LIPSPEAAPGGSELTVTVVVRGENATADVARVVNAALAMPGVKDIRIERKDP